MVQIAQIQNKRIKTERNMNNSFIRGISAITQCMSNYELIT